jgi:hypothetical protein
MMTNIANAKKTLIRNFSTADRAKRTGVGVFLTFAQRKWLGASFVNFIPGMQRVKLTE